MAISDFNMFLDCLAIVILCFILYAGFLDRGKSHSVKKFLTGALFAAILCLIDFFSYLLDGNSEFLYINYTISTAAFCLGYFQIIILTEYQFAFIKVNEKTERFITGIYEVFFVILSVFTFIFAVTGGLFYYENGYYHRGEYWILFMSFPMIALILNCIIILLSKNSDTKQRLTFTFISLIPAIGLIISYFIKGLSMQPLIMLMTIFVLYINIYIERNNDFYRNEVELQNSRVDVMISQIQPHFLYNSLSSVASLCRTDPERAADVITDFGKYLRGNLDSLKQHSPIPFSRELSHINAYIELEKVRLEDKLNVIFDIQVKDFSLPPLSIQPLVENAVKHGIAETSKSGTVVITSYDDDNNYYIEIIDNGCGYDTSTPLNENESHIGIENVKRRLELMCGGYLEIESELGKGTTSRVIIPKKGKGVIVNENSGN